MMQHQGEQAERMVGLVAVSSESRKAVEAAFRSYESRLFHAALRVTRNEDDAWDAVQEGMVSALRHADRFRGDAAVASWMYSIVVNAALYQRRRTAARKRGVDKYTDLVWPDAEQSVDTCTQHRDPETYVMARVDLARAAEQIALLPEEKRTLVEQAIGGGLLRGDRRGRRAAGGGGEEQALAHSPGPARADGPRRRGVSATGW